MLVNRRFALGSTVAAGAAALLPRVAWSRSSLELVDGTLTILSDGNLRLPGAMITQGAPEAEAAEILARYDVNPEVFEPECNITLLQRGDRTILFDAGSGGNFMPSSGKLLDAIYDMGLAPEDITDVVFTHAHPDHLWGILDDFDDLAFYEANYHIGQAEWDYWTDPDTVNSIGDDRTAFAVGAQSRLDLIAERINMIADGAEVLPGVVAHHTPGHTPGHLAFEVSNGGESVMVLGDCIGNHHLAFERPMWASGSDQDAELGAATRTALLDQLATDQMRVIGFHLPGNGMGYVERRGSGNHFIADAG